MHRRRPSAREQKRVAVARPSAGLDRFDAAGPDDALDRNAMRHSHLGRGAARARIEDLDLRAGLGQGLGHSMGAVVVGRDGNAPADQDRIAAEIDERRVGGHDAWPVVVGDDERPLDRAGRDDDPLRPDPPERVGERRPPFPG